MRNGRRKIKKVTQEERNSTVFRQRVVLGIIAGILLLYLAVSLHYVWHFQKNTRINNIDVSGMTLKAAKAALIEKGADGYALTVKGPAGASETISGEGLDLRVVSADEAKKCLRKQNPFTWLTRNSKEKEYTIDLGTSFDTEVLNARIEALGMMDYDEMEPPVNAFLQVAEDGSYEIVPEVVGTELNDTETLAGIAEAVGACRTSVDVTRYQYYPEITADNENLVTRRDEWNGFMKAVGLTYDVAEEIVTFDGPKIASLLQDDGNHVTLSMEKIRDMVAEWKYDNDTYAHAFKFTTYYGNEVTIDPYGNYGYEIDDETLPGELYERIISGDTGSYDVPYYHEPLYHTNKGLGGNYVEISVDDQHVWVWKDGEVVVDTEVVTGLPVFGRVTYYGCYAINLKQEHAVLGDVDVEGYSREVNYWVRFNGGEGLHDAVWRDNFGGQIWLYAGSHGCVNVPEWVMADIYNNVEVGEPVVVYGKQYDESVHTKGNGEVNIDYYVNYDEE